MSTGAHAVAPARAFAAGIAPSYDGWGLANLPRTLLDHFDAPSPPGIVPLAPEAAPAEVFAGARRVLLLVLDGLGWRRLLQAVDEGIAPGFRRVMREGSACAITTVLPSTTAAALATLGSGLPPSQHGILGYRMHLPRLGYAANMVRLTPTVSGGRSLLDLGLEPEDLLQGPTFVERLVAAGTPARVVTRSAYVASGLSRLLYRSVRPDGYVGVGDFFTRTRRALAGLGNGSGFVEAYWDLLDTVAHRYGDDSDEWRAELAAFDAGLTREILEGIDDPDALLLVTADHGHVPIPQDRVLHWNDVPGLFDDLVLPPTGEGRFSYLHVRNSHKASARRRIEQAWASAAVVVDTADAIRDGVFGPPPYHPELAARTGDLLVVARGQHRLTYAPTKETAPPVLLGHHGGVTPEEMLVPLLACRLG